MPVKSSRDKYVKVGSVNTRYWQSGDTGSAIILVHGFPGSLEDWEQNIDALAQRHRVYALDWLGSGRTDRLPLVNDLYELEPFITGFMDALSIDKAAFIGYSMGGGISLLLAINQPARVKKMVLVASAGLGPEVAGIYRLASWPPLGRIMFKNPTRNLIQMTINHILYDPTRCPPGLMDVYYETSRLPGDLAAKVAIAHAGSTFFGQRAKYWKTVRAALPQIKIPTIIFWGKQDQIIPVKHALIAARLPGSKLHIYDKCGHAVMMEYPDEFNKITLDFLAKN